MISVERVTVRFGAFDLLSNISFVVNDNDRIGLVGKNGAGKSTLMKILSGQRNSDEGLVVIPSGFKVGYLSQVVVLGGSNTILQEASEAFEEVIRLEEKIEHINQQLAGRTDYESDAYLNLIHSLTDYSERLTLLGGHSYQGEIERTLTGLGFESSDMNRKVSEFSGGWRMRVELAKILLRKPDLLLLDEPTNHLDIESIQWLEDYLKTYSGAVILISHDRAFLDNVTQRTIEISLGKIYDYDVAYSKYVVLRAERREQQIAAFRNQQKMIEDTQDFIDRFRYKPSKSVQVQSRIKSLEKIDRIEIDQEDNSHLSIRFPTPIRSGKDVLTLRGVTKSYGSKTILKDIDLLLESGSRIAFVGKNGEGKTTLSKIILGLIEYEGLCKLGHNVKIGYFAQDRDEQMDENVTVFETIDKVAVGDIRLKIRDILGAFMFSGEDVDKKVKVLSGGERSRLAMAKLLLEPYNMLVLDEPTNHLDMRSKDILKNALLNYEGTLILVSHDREFLDGLIDKLYEFKGGKIKEFLGGIYDFLAKKKIDSFRELERKTTPVVADNSETIEPSVGKQSYLDKKEQDKIIRQAARKVQDSEQHIAKLEADLKDLDEIMCHPDRLAAQPDQQAFYKRYEEVKKQIDVEMENWSLLHDEYEKLAK